MSITELNEDESIKFKIFLIWIIKKYNFIYFSKFFAKKYYFLSIKTYFVPWLIEITVFYLFAISCLIWRYELY